MKRRHKPLQPWIKNRAYREAFKQLAAALAENTPFDNREKNRLMRLAFFADVDALQQSGRIIIPK